MKIYVINLDRSPERMALMTQRLDGLSFERFPAIDSREIDYAGPLSRGEAACAMSHRALWQRLLENDEPCICILEDDIEISPDFPDLVQNTNWLPARFDTIKLETTAIPTLLQQSDVIHFGERRLKRIRSAHWGSGAYIINRDGARRMLAASDGLDMPVDWVLFNLPHLRWQTAYQLLPAPCKQDRENIPSVIGDGKRFGPPSLERKGMEKLHWEVVRPVRRMQHWLDTRRWKSNYETVEFS